MEEIVTKSLAWYRSLSLEGRTQVDVDNARSFSQKTAGIVAIWSFADTRREGLLHQREFESLLTIQDQRKLARGVPNEPLTDE